MGIYLVLSDCVDIKQLGADVGGIYNIIFNVYCEIKEGRKEMFYLTTHATHLIYGYMASDIWLRTILPLIPVDF